MAAMTRISRFKLSPKQQEYLTNEFWEAVASLDTTESGETFLQPFFSPTEPIMFAKRLEILKRLRQDEPYEQIMRDLKVTPTTVSKMANILHTANEEFLEILDDFIRNQKERWEKRTKKQRFHPSKRFWPM